MFLKLPVSLETQIPNLIEYSEINLNLYITQVSYRTGSMLTAPFSKQAVDQTNYYLQVTATKLCWVSAENSNFSYRPLF